MPISLTDPDLFGNDAAEDEDEEVFKSYALDRPELAAFTDAKRKICVARAYKGEGKSALLRLVRAHLEEDPHAFIISATGASLSPDTTAEDTDAWVRLWKREVFALIAREVGARIGMAWSDDSIALVEEAEQNGFKKRSPLSSITDRLLKKAGPVERSRVGTGSHEETLKRWTSGKPAMWIIVDDVDQNFKNNARYRMKVASFFIACRQMTIAVPQLRFRLAVRPNVWTTIKFEFEALSHVEQYAIDMRWDEDDTRRLLSRRIEAYLKRTAQEGLLPKEPPNEHARDKDIIAIVFQPTMKWGETTRPPHVLLHTLSRHRPRWVVELSKVSAQRAARAAHGKVMQPDITACLDVFGSNRIADMVAEFSAQCPELEEMVAAFSRQAEDYKTDELVKAITNRILNSVSPHIVGVVGRADALDVASFLFEIGFLSARRNYANGTYEHITYSEQPALLRTRTNIDDGVSWEIHPVFRQALQLRSASGESIAPHQKRGR
jgi:hypothetical protein